MSRYLNALSIASILDGTAGTMHKVIFTCFLSGCGLFLFYIGLDITSFPQLWERDTLDEKSNWIGVMIGIVTMVAGAAALMCLPFFILFVGQSSRRVARSDSPKKLKNRIKYKGNIYTLPAFKEYCIQNPIELINARIVREFNVDGPGSMRAWFTGSVGYYVATGPIWGIRYNDGDEEECYIDDLIVRLRDTIQQRGVNLYY